VNGPAPHTIHVQPGPHVVQSGVIELTNSISIDAVWLFGDMDSQMRVADSLIARAATYGLLAESFDGRIELIRSTIVDCGHTGLRDGPSRRAFATGLRDGPRDGPSRRAFATGLRDGPSRRASATGLATGNDTTILEGSILSGNALDVSGALIDCGSDSASCTEDYHPWSIRCAMTERSQHTASTGASPF